MTTEVISVDPDTSVQALAALLSERGISGIPVVDSANRVVGVVGESNLLHRVETRTEQRTAPVVARHDSVRSGAARDYVKPRAAAIYLGGLVIDLVWRRVSVAPRQGLSPRA